MLPDAFGDDGEVPVRSAASRRTARRALGLVGILLVGGLALLIGVALFAPASGKEVRYVVPHGTAAALRAKTATSPLPALIELKAEDTLVIENQDDEAFTFGAFQIRAGETFSHRFTRRGRFGEVCTIHPNGSVDVVVT